MTNTPTSRPQGESATPRTDARWKEEWAVHERHPESSPAHGMCDLCEELERELAQALRQQAESGGKEG